MSEPSPVYYADLIPTPAELKLLARLRQLRGMAFAFVRLLCHNLIRSC
jgi:hypothetical protein